MSKKLNKSVADQLNRLLVGKYLKAYPSDYSQARRRAFTEQLHRGGNWRFDDYAKPPKAIRQAVSRRAAVFCPHCGVKGWRRFRTVGGKIVTLDSGEQCRTVTCWSCSEVFVLSAKCVGQCPHRQDCLHMGVTHPKLNVKVEQD